MILEREYSIGPRDVGTSNLLTNSGMLSILEDIACLHSDIVGYGVNQLPQTNLSWVILNWKVSMFSRVSHAATLKVKTWARKYNKFVTLRDFEIYNEDNILIGIASSKWALIDATTGRLAKITDEVMNAYDPEDKHVFEDLDIDKLKEPNLDSKEPTFSFKVLKRDIDVNKHMHNLYYLDYACEVIPEGLNINNFEIMYKTAARLGEEVNCFYVVQDNCHYVIMKNKTNDKLNCIVKLY